MERRGDHLKTLRCKEESMLSPHLVCRLGDGLVLCLTNSIQERGREVEAALGRRGSQNELLPECFDFGKINLIKECQI